MKARKLWLINVLLVLLSLPLALVVAEVAVRVLSPQPTGLSHQDRYGLAMHYPGITRYLPQYDVTVTFNKAGMRDREHTLEKPAGVYRILFLGDSFMEAVQVAFEASLPALVEKGLGELQGKKVEVINAGVSGWGTDDQLRYLNMYGMKYQPDLVLVNMTLHNDLSENLQEKWHTVRDSTLVAQQVEPFSEGYYRKVQLKAFISTRFQLYQLWRRVRHGGEIRRAGRALNTHVTDIFREPTPPRIERGLVLTEHLLKAVRDSAGAGGAKLAVVLLPIRYQLDDSLFVQFAKRMQARPEELELGRPQREIGEIASRLNIPVIDLLPRFRQWTAESDVGLFLEWDGHWNAEGHKLAAQVVVEKLKQPDTVE